MKKDYYYIGTTIVLIAFIIFLLLSTKKEDIFSFTNKQENSPYITILSPKANETLTSGTTQKIIWKDAVGSSNYEIKLENELNGSYTIASGQLGSEYIWTVGNMSALSTIPIPNGSYVLKVCRTATTDCSSENVSLRGDVDVKTTVDLKVNNSDGVTTVTKGEAVYSTWKSTDSEYCYESGDVLENKNLFRTNLNSNSDSGTYPIFPEKTGNFTMHCQGPTGLASDTVRISVIGPQKKCVYPGFYNEKGELVSCPAPEIISVNPSSGGVGDIITIYGNNFNEDDVEVDFDDSNWDLAGTVLTRNLLSISPTMVKFKIDPQNFKNYKKGNYLISVFNMNGGSEYLPFVISD